jgi:hypothetical protein
MFLLLIYVVDVKRECKVCEEAFDRLRHQGLQDGVMDIVFAWDAYDGDGPQR